MAKIVADWSPEPNPKEMASVKARLARLDKGLGGSAQAVVDETGAWALDELRIRRSFAWRSTAPAGDYSDRVTPPRHLRPSATRIANSQGAALRFYLTALARTQVGARPGKRFSNDLATRPPSGERGWTDLLATDAVPRTGKNTSATVKDKKVRQIHGALETLAEAGLVDLASGPGTRGRYEQFQLLHEAGALHPSSDPELYSVPKKSDPTLVLPGGFIRQGWVHVLLDSEIALLMMIACGVGSLPLNDNFVAVPGDVRLLHYGIGRDPFTTAHRMLQRFGLVEVIEVNRRGDGRSVGEDAPSLHRLRLQPDAFDDPAVESVRNHLERQLKRME